MKLLSRIILLSPPVGVGLLIAAQILGICSPPWWVMLLPFAPAAAFFVVVTAAILLLIAFADESTPFQ